MDEFFKVAGDLDDNAVRNSNKYIKMAGNLDNGIRMKTNFNSLKNKSIVSKEMIEDYLITVVSGKKLGDECELGTLCGEGSMIVSFKKLQEIVNEGTYNIVSADVFNTEMILIVFEKYSKTNTMRFR